MTTDEILDDLYDLIDSMMREGRFDEIDEMLEAVSVNDCSINFLLGILTATLPGDAHLKRRAQFFDDVKTTLIDRKEYEDRLLAGLEAKGSTP